MNKFLTATILIAAFAVFVSGCASSQPATSAANTAANTTATNAAPNNQTASQSHGGASTADETPAAIKAAFPNAQSFTTQHKDVSDKAAADIEKNAGAKVPERDHHSYLAFTSENGTRRQIGAATVVKAVGRDVVIIYENKNGLPYIKEVRAENVPAEFLAQFAGKGHDDKIQINADLKINGADAATAKAIADAVRVDAITMQTLYGASHTH